MIQSVATSRAPETKPASKDAGAADEVAPSTVAFEALLEASRAFLGSASMSGGQVVEEQMFESPRRGEGAGGRVAADQDAQRAVGQDQNHRGVQARRAQRDADIGTGGSMSSRAKGGSPSASLQSAATPAEIEGKGTGLQPANMVKDLSPSNIPARSAIGADSTTALGSNNQSPGAAASTGVQSSGSLPSPAVVATGRAGAESGSALARQVGELLASGRGGENQGARAGANPAGGDVGNSGVAARNQGSPTGRTKEAATGRSTSEPRSPEVTRRSQFDQLIRSLRFETGAGRSTARLKLDPPGLGRMDIELKWSDGDLRINVRTTSAEARDILFERVADLRGALQQHGVRIEQFEVTADLGREAADAPAGDGTLLEGERGATDGSHQDRSEGRTEESSHSEGTGTRTERESHWEVVEESRLDVRV